MIVYLDTNVYIGAKYMFDREKFATLQSRIKEGKITVLYTNATIGEVLKNLKENIEAGVLSYNRLLRNDLACLCGDEKEDLHSLDPEKVITQIKDKLDVFLGLDGVKCISLNPLDAEQLMGDYFHSVAPFEKKKPYEFKDAIMVNAVKQYQKECGEEICIVSSDSGFRSAFSGNSNFETFEFLGQFFKHYQHKQEELAALEVKISEAIERGDYDEIFKDYCSDLDVDRGTYSEWECEDKSIDEIHCSLSYIEECAGSIYATVDIELYLTADINYRDEDNSYYDHEDDQYLIENFITAIEKHCVLLDIRIECLFIKDDEGNQSLEDVKIVPAKRLMTLDIDDDTMFDYEEVSNTFEESEDVEYCSECKKIIGRYTDVMYFDYQGNSLCNDCAVSNSSGEICPTCGLKFPSELMVSGFCCNCASAEE